GGDGRRCLGNRHIGNAADPALPTGRARAGHRQACGPGPDGRGGLAARAAAVSPTVSPARACAFTVLRRAFEQGAYADRALRSGAAELDTRDRALAMQLVYGTVQRRATLDHLASTLLRPTLSELEPAVLAV